MKKEHITLDQIRYKKEIPYTYEDMLVSPWYSHMEEDEDDTEVVKADYIVMDSDGEYYLIRGGYGLYRGIMEMFNEYKVIAYRKYYEEILPNPIIKKIECDGEDVELGVFSSDYHKYKRLKNTMDDYYKSKITKDKKEIKIC